MGRRPQSCLPAKQVPTRSHQIPILPFPGSAWATLVITRDSWSLAGASLAGGTYFGSRKTLSPFWQEFDPDEGFHTTGIISVTSGV